MKKIGGIVVGLLSLYTWCQDTHHFFKASSLFCEPRIARKGLTSAHIQAFYGMSRHALSHQGNRTALWNMYGTSSMHELAVGVAGKDLTNPLDLLIMQLNLEPSRQTHEGGITKEWATYSISGAFKSFNTSLYASYNISKHLFVDVSIPVRAFFYHNPCFTDISPTDSIFPNNTTAVWQAFQTSFDAILERYSLNRNASDEWGLGDLSCAVGYTYSHQDTTVLDFVDITLKAGLIIPTGKRKNEDKIFSLAMGNDGHLGFQASCDVSLGMYEWLTLATHLSATGFIDHTKTVRLKTGSQQRGLIFLAKDKADIHRGNILNAGVSCKADHIAWGLSFGTGYSFTYQDNGSIKPHNSFYSRSIASDNEMIKRWKMHTIHTSLEYDFSKKVTSWGPTLSLYYNTIIKGNRIFKTDMFGAECGVNCIWTF